MMFDRVKRIDVIVPCYNYGRFLDACVQSILQQPGVDTRVLIIDDASQDDTREVASRLTQADPRVEYRRHASNHGHIATYNEGIEWVSADYMLLVSADDALTPGALFRAVALMEAHPEVGFVYGPVTRVLEEVPALSAPQPPYDTRVVRGEEFITSACEAQWNPVAAPTAVVRGPLQKRLGGYRPELTHSGDFEMWLRFAAHASVGYVTAHQALYRQHGLNMHIRYEQVIGHLRQRRSTFALLFETYGKQLRDRTRLRDVAYRNIATEAFWQACRAFDGGNVAACREALAFAAETYPSLRSTRSWKRLWVKLLVGPRLWSALEPFVNWIRQQLSGRLPESGGLRQLDHVVK